MQQWWCNIPMHVQSHTRTTCTSDVDDVQTHQKNTAKYNHTCTGHIPQQPSASFYTPWAYTLCIHNPPFSGLCTSCMDTSLKTDKICQPWLSNTPCISQLCSLMFAKCLLTCMWCPAEVRSTWPTSHSLQKEFPVDLPVWAIENF